MAKIVCPFNASGICECDGKPCNLACGEGKAMARLYTAGYRKASDVAREIFEEINELKKQYASGDIDGNTLYVRLYMLEKKYTEEGK